MTKTTWTLDTAHSEVGFKVKHMMISNVKGHFDKFDVNFETEGEDFSTASINVKIDTSSVNTANEQRDGHLKSADFFESDAFAFMTFTSKSMEKISEDEFVLTGDFTIKNITKEIKMNVEFGGILKDPWGNQKAGFTLTGKINRKDWGLTWNAALETGGILVGDDVNLICEIQFAKAA